MGENVQSGDRVYVKFYMFFNSEGLLVHKKFKPLQQWS